MSGLTFRERRKRSKTVNITSLIDVLFLMLIFLMVSTTFAEHAAIKLDLPKAKQTEMVEVDELTLTMTQDGRLLLDNAAIDKSELESRLKDAVEANAEARLNLKADQGVPYGRVVEVIDLVRSSGIRRLSAFAQPPREGGAPSAP